MSTQNCGFSWIKQYCTQCFHWNAELFVSLWKKNVYTEKTFVSKWKRESVEFLWASATVIVNTVKRKKYGRRSLACLYILHLYINSYCSVCQSYILWYRLTTNIASLLLHWSYLISGKDVVRNKVYIHACKDAGSVTIWKSYSLINNFLYSPNSQA